MANPRNLKVFHSMWKSLWKLSFVPHPCRTS